MHNEELKDFLEDFFVENFSVKYSEVENVIDKFVKELNMKNYMIFDVRDIVEF